MVAFGDVNLSEEPIHKGNPGAGGWPTIRYYNKETGYEGQAYDKKTDKPMCQELGDPEMMKAYVLEAGGVFECEVATGTGCTDMESNYIEKMRAASADERGAMLERLGGMRGGQMKPELKKWLMQRIAILKQLAGAEPKEEL